MMEFLNTRKVLTTNTMFVVSFFVNSPLQCALCHLSTYWLFFFLREKFLLFNVVESTIEHFEHWVIPWGIDWLKCPRSKFEKIQSYYLFKRFSRLFGPVNAKWADTSAGKNWRFTFKLFEITTASGNHPFLNVAVSVNSEERAHRTLIGFSWAINMLGRLLSRAIAANKTCHFIYSSVMSNTTSTSVGHLKYWIEFWTL